MKVRVDVSSALANIDRAKANSAAGVEAMVEAAASQVVSILYAGAPRDTNRFIRGWLEGARAAGLGSWPMPDIQVSQFNKRYELVLRAQIRWATSEIESLERRIDKWFIARNRPIRGWALRARRKIERLRNIVIKQQELLEAIRAGKSVVLMDVGAANFHWAGEDDATLGDIRHGYYRKNKKTGKVSRVLTLARGYDRTFGGSGSRFRSGRTFVIAISNLEPHARIVEKKTRLLATARMRLKHSGATMHKGVYVKKAMEGTDWKRVG